MAELSKAYLPGEVEEKWYARWQHAGCFAADAASAKPGYSIVIPPPNVTGILHLGHVLNNTLQDILARRARQEGYEVLWLPGTDHAGIGTQTQVERHLRKTEGKTRRDLGREEFLRRVWEWRDKFGGIIISQLKRLGCSCDWSRLRFTMDEAYSRDVQRVFVELFKRGLIYRGQRMVNWCPASLTALSDEEVIPKTQKGKLYTMRYEVVEQPGRFLEISTTRPETLMGDTAVAVNPTDERYQDLIGRHVWRPFPREAIPVIADDAVDKEFGTGALKVTPAHDRADFEIGRRHNLPVRDILHPDGRIHCPECPDLDDLDRFKARVKAAEKLTELGALVKEEDYQNNVGFSERAGVPIEPRLSLQWFLKYPAVAETAAAVERGVVTFRPERWKKTFAHWMANIQDWCISRQLWWGHRIPAWHRAGKESLLERHVPVLDLADNILSGETIRDLRQSAMSYLDGQGWIDHTLRNEDSGLDLMLRRGSAQHAFTNAGAVNIHLVPLLPELIRTAIYIGSECHEPPAPTVRIVHLFYGAVRFRGAVHAIKIVAKELADGTRIYDWKSVHKSESGSTSPPTLPVAGKLVERPIPDSGAILGDLFDDVNMDPAFVRVQATAPGPDWTQDEDTTDTWFSSWLWPYATMDEATFEKFYPTSDLVTGPDIIFFWVARMIMAGLEFKGQIPFRNVFFTSIIRDKKGDKMSKTLGNSPDPMDLMAKYGADGLRFGLLRIAPTGTDVKFDEAQIEEGRNFANKLWNAARFRQMQGGEVTREEGGVNIAGLSVFGVDIMAKLDRLHAEYAAALDDYSFNAAAQGLYDFFWANYCDLFLEAAKTGLAAEADASAKAATLRVMDAVYGRFLQLLHPFMPHVTEELWATLGYAEDGRFLMQTPLATVPLLAGVEAEVVIASKAMASACYESAARIRNLKAACNLAASRDLRFVLKPSAAGVDHVLPMLRVLAGAAEITVQSDYVRGRNTAAAVTPLGEIYLPLEGLIDVEIERTRLAKEASKVRAEIEKVDAKLNSESFVSRAPAEVVDEHRARRESFVAQEKQWQEMLANLSG